MVYCWNTSTNFDLLLCSKNTCVSEGDSPFCCSADEAKAVINGVRTLFLLSINLFTVLLIVNTDD